MSTSGEMIPQHVRLYATNGGYSSARLIDDIEAGPLITDHLLQSADLAFDAAQPRQLTAVVRYGLERTCSLTSPHILKTAAAHLSIPVFARHVGWSNIHK